jgi:ribosomal protein S18 acetylase RimI-like enzyme
MAPVTLRPATPDDLPFLRALYGSTRAEELAPVPWGADEKEAFLDQQFEAQHQYYHAAYAGASFDLVLRGGEPVGRLYVARWPGEIRVMDVALLPGARGGGIGTALLRAVLEEGRARGVPVTIHVEKLNPALALYRRLGFVEAADKGVYWFLEWRPEAAPAAEAAAEAAAGAATAGAATAEDVAVGRRAAG